MDTFKHRIEALRPEVDQIMIDLATRIRGAIINDRLIKIDPEISAIRDELLQLLTDPSNLQFGILKRESHVPTTTETGRYLAGVSVKRAPGNARGAARMPILPNRVAGRCSFDDLFEELTIDRYGKLIEFECLQVLAKIQERRDAVRTSGDRFYTMIFPYGPSGTYHGGETARKKGITRFSQENIDDRYEKRAQWLLHRLAGGESPFLIVQPFKKISPDYKEKTP